MMQYIFPNKRLGVNIPAFSRQHKQHEIYNNKQNMEDAFLALW